MFITIHFMSSLALQHSLNFSDRRTSIILSMPNDDRSSYNSKVKSPKSYSLEAFQHFHLMFFETASSWNMKRYYIKTTPVFSNISQLSCCDFTEFSKNEKINRKVKNDAGYFLSHHFWSFRKWKKKQPHFRPVCVRRGEGLTFWFNLGQIRKLF